MKSCKCWNSELKMRAVFMLRTYLFGITYDTMYMIRLMMMKEQMQIISGYNYLAQAYYK